MLKYAALSVLLLVAACAVPYSKPGVSESAAHDAFMACDHSTGAYAHGVEAGAVPIVGALFAYGSGQASQDQANIDACMSAQGYVKTDN